MSYLFVFSFYKSILQLYFTKVHFSFFQIPPTSVPGDYKLRVEGLYDGVTGGVAFLNETQLMFSQRSMTIFIQTDKPIYKQSETSKLNTKYK